MTASEDAYEVAKQWIENTIKGEAVRLDLDQPETRALTTLPPSIAEATSLRTLDLDNTQITDIAPLQSLSGLQTLWLNDTQVTDIAPLRSLSGLQTLWLRNTQITDIAPLQSLSGLQELSLSNTQITDIARLQSLSGLQTLSLSNTEITDIAPLQSLTGMQELYLRNTQITDLRPIAHLDSLIEGSKRRRFGLTFPNTPATRTDETLRTLSEIEDDAERTEKTLAYLRSLPKWPEPYTPEGTDIVIGGPKPQTIRPPKFGRQTPPSKPIALKPLTLTQARAVLEVNGPNLRAQCQFAVSQLSDTLAHHLPAKPNEEDALAEWQKLNDTLLIAQTALVTLYEALPEEAAQTEITEDDASRLKKGFDATIAKLQDASRYIDSAEDEAGRTYAGLLKLGVSVAVGAPLAVIVGAPSAAVAAGVYTMLYGKGAALDALKAIKDPGAPE